MSKVDISSTKKKSMISWNYQAWAMFLAYRENSTGSTQPLTYLTKIHFHLIQFIFLNIWLRIFFLLQIDMLVCYTCTSEPCTYGLTLLVLTRGKRCFWDRLRFMPTNSASCRFLLHSMYILQTECFICIYV